MSKTMSFAIQQRTVRQMNSDEIRKLKAAMSAHIEYFALTVDVKLTDSATDWLTYTASTEEYMILAHFYMGYIRGLGFDIEGNRSS